MLASVGLYGILSVFISRRRKEIGIRIAIGAQPVSVLWMVLRQTLILMGAGVVTGLALGLWSNKLISSQLFGLQPNDLLTTVLSVGVLVGVGFCSALFPAKRASNMDPIAALRYE